MCASTGRGSCVGEPSETTSANPVRRPIQRAEPPELKRAPRRRVEPRDRIQRRDVVVRSQGLQCDRRERRGPHRRDGRTDLLLDRSLVHEPVASSDSMITSSPDRSTGRQRMLAGPACRARVTGELRASATPVTTTTRRRSRRAPPRATLHVLARLRRREPGRERFQGRRLARRQPTRQHRAPRAQASERLGDAAEQGRRSLFVRERHDVVAVEHRRPRERDERPPPREQTLVLPAPRGRPRGRCDHEREIDAHGCSCAAGGYVGDLGPSRAAEPVDDFETRSVQVPSAAVSPHAASSRSKGRGPSPRDGSVLHRHPTLRYLPGHR